MDNNNIFVRVSESFECLLYLSSSRFLYILFGGGMTAYIVINVALKEPSKLISLAGLACFILLMVLLSNNKRKVCRFHLSPLTGRARWPNYSSF